MTEAILENESCFLENGTWIAVIRSIITDDPNVPERSTVAISLIILMLRIPRLFRDMTTVICSQASPSFTATADLISRARDLRMDLKDWYLTYIGPDDRPIVGTNPSLSDGSYKLLVLFYLCSIYSNRLNTCINWTEASEIDEIEEQTQLFARTIERFCEGASSFQSSLILAQKLPIAEATIATGDEWQAQWQCRSRTMPGQLFRMPESTFSQWCKLFGRKIS